MSHLGFLTHQQLPDLTESDRLALPHLAAAGIRVTPAVWDDPAVDWAAFDALVLRSPWDYSQKAAAFARWLDAIEALGVTVWNPLAVVRWNIDKRYLERLGRRGVPVVPTRYLDAGTRVDLGALLADAGWPRAVVKPVVSAGGWQTWVTTSGTAAADQAALDALLADRGVLVQPFMPEIVQDGEWSLVFFDGAYSHAVLKHPAAGDFRVQSGYGGSFEPATAAPELIAQAAEVLATVEERVLYARVDGVVRAGRFVLMELELFEPALYLTADAGAPARFAAACIRWTQAIA